MSRFKHTLKLEKVLFFHILLVSMGMAMDRCNLMKHRDGVGENEYVITLSNLRAQRTFDHFVMSQRREEKKKV